VNQKLEDSTNSKRAKLLDALLWLTQSLLALTFFGGGVWKLITPVRELAAMIPWAGQVSPAFLYATASFDILGGVGVILPAITRIAPRLTVLAAVGCALLQASAIVFHFWREEAANTPFNFLVLTLCLFLVWGRGVAAPLRPRSSTR
jgi:uncharacterized membrane protein